MQVSNSLFQSHTKARDIQGLSEKGIQGQGILGLGLVTSQNSSKYPRTQVILVSMVCIVNYLHRDTQS